VNEGEVDSEEKVTWREGESKGRWIRTRGSCRKSEIDPWIRKVIQADRREKIDSSWFENAQRRESSYINFFPYAANQNFFSILRICKVFSRLWENRCSRDLEKKSEAMKQFVPSLGNNLNIKIMVWETWKKLGNADPRPEAYGKMLEQRNKFLES
jgi:hypothetical protein